MLLLLLNQSSSGPTNFGRMLAQTHGIGLGGDAMYPRNATSPPRIAIGAVLQISDGAVQTSGVDITVRGEGGTEATGAGTIAYGASGIVYYTPTQAETNFTAFVVIASKAACLPVAQTIVTSASVTAGQVRLEGVTHTGAVIPTVTSVTNPVTAGTVSDKTGYSITNLTVSAGTTLASGTHQPQTGDSFARIGANGSGLTSIGDTRLANLDAAVSSRMATFSLPANFAALGINASGHVTRVTTVDTATAVTTVNGLANNVITTASIANGSYTNAKFATGAIRVAGDEFGTSLVISNLATAGQIPSEFTSSTFASAGVFSVAALANAPAGGGGGGGGNPWLTDIGTGYTGTQAGKVLMDAKAKTDLIVAGNVTYTSMVDPEGEIPGPIFIGDDYKTVHANAFSWTIPAIPGMTAATAVVRFGGVNALLGRAWLVTGTATDLGGGLWRLVCEMDKSVSSNLLPGLYDWTVEVSLSGGNEITRVYSDRKVEVRSKPT